MLLSQERARVKFHEVPVTVVSNHSPCFNAHAQVHTARRVNVESGIEEYVVNISCVRGLTLRSQVSVSSINDAYSSALCSSQSTISTVAFRTSHAVEVMSQHSSRQQTASRPFYSRLAVTRLSTDLPIYNARFRPPSYNRDHQVLLITPL
jgi:hypothetical protein